MEQWICTVCGTQFAPSEQPPQPCPTCEDERSPRGYKEPSWTTLAQMRKDGFHTIFKEQESGLVGIGTEPTFSIGQRAMLVQMPEGNILWDCLTYLDDETVAEVKRLGGIRAIAISHPHYYGSMVEWAHRFDAPIYLHEADQQWVMRPDQSITFWSGDTFPLVDGVELIRLGGHFAGGTVLHWKHASDGKGVLLSGDIISVIPNPVRPRVTFMYSYTTLLPLPASEIRRIRAAIKPYDFDRIYAAWFAREILTDASTVVLDCADRYIHVLEQFERASGQS